eukprot:TRINITY_DN62676_c0_g1_i1.p1 TRINITY_DN62676_c0_g1~~TRINITY_DN62676_c0_g1_i1.p1  ORF type:complete len:673 (+),score=82.74 TRINITY_DN62676_c0_g1_i1:159-2177(+)
MACVVSYGVPPFRGPFVYFLLTLWVCANGIDSLANMFEFVKAERKNNEIVAVMTTTPSRIWTSLTHAILGILKQKTRPDRIILCIPRGHLRRSPAYTFPSDEQLPDHLRRPPLDWNLVVDRTCPDKGPSSGLRNGLRRSAPDALVINVADDLELGEDHFTVLVWLALKQPGIAISVAGLHSDVAFRPCLDSGAWEGGCGGRAYWGQTFGPLTLGWLGVVFRPWFFGPHGEPEEPAAEEWPEACLLHDDIWIGAMLARRGIRRRAYDLNLSESTARFDFIDDATALRPNNRQSLLDCNAALVSRWPRLWQPRPRLVGVRHDFVPTCVGHVDHWYDARVPTTGTDASMMDAIVDTTPWEHVDTIVLWFQGTQHHLERPALCVMFSRVMQCATQRPDNVCTGVHASASVVAAGSMRAWRFGTDAIHIASVATRQDTVPMLRMQDADDVSLGGSSATCWISGQAEATWSRCCGASQAADGASDDTAHNGDEDVAPLAVASLAKIPIGDLHGNARFQESRVRLAVPLVGCPRPSSGCCTIHPRLTARWAAFDGTWDAVYEDGGRGTWRITEDGLVHWRSSARGRGAFDARLEPSSEQNSGLIRLPRLARWRCWRANVSSKAGEADIGNGWQQCGATPLTEVWRFTHDAIHSTVFFNGGQLASFGIARRVMRNTGLDV